MTFSPQVILDAFMQEDFYEGRYVKGDTKCFSRHYSRGEYNVENLKLSRDHHRKPQIREQMSGPEIS